MVKDSKTGAFQGLNPAGPVRSATPCPTCWSTMRCATPHVLQGFWRSVNLNQNTIYLECFLDEVAHATGKTRWACAAS